MPDTVFPYWTILSSCGLTHFEQGLGRAERGLLISMLGLARRLPEHDAEQAFESACSVRGIDAGSRTFVRCLEVLDDSFLRTDGGAAVHLSFINPSLIDFLRTYLLRSSADCELAISGARYFEQVDWLWNALSDGKDSPPSRFASAFSEAFGRTLEAQAAGGADFSLLLEMSWLMDDQPIEGRLRQVLRYIEALPELRDFTGAWAGVAKRWLGGVHAGEIPVRASTPSLLRDLSDTTVLDLNQAAAIVKERVDQMETSPDRWACLDELHEISPSLFSDTEWGEIRGEFDLYVTEVLEDPVAWLNGADDVDTLEYHAGSLGSTVSYGIFDDARDAFSEEEDSDGFDPGSYEPEPDDGDFTDTDFGESDADIEAMFDRLD